MPPTTTVQGDTLKDTTDRFPLIGETSPDKDGMVRPVFRVGDVSVAFYAQDDESRLVDHDESRATAVVASPLGLTEAAIHLANLNDESRAARLYNSIKAEDYNDDVLHYLDQINAAVSFDEHDGTQVSRVDEGGFALILAALEGDSAAQSTVDARLEHFQEAYAQAEADSIPNASAEEVEKAKELLNNIAIVHSTKHAVNRDTDGNVLLSATGDHRRQDDTIDDRYPRATLHFTMNGEVTNHQFNDSWVDTNTLIIAPLAKTIEAGRLPHALNPVDTYFDVNPGEKLKLPDAITITPRDSLSGLYQQEGSNISYKRTDHYSDEDRKAYAELVGRPMILVEAMTDEQLAAGLRHYAIEDALKQCGVTERSSLIQSNASGSGEFDKRVREAGRALGLETTLHNHLPVARAEQRIRQDADSTHQYTYTLSSEVPLTAQRMYVANGYLAPGSHLPAEVIKAREEMYGDGL